MGHAVISFGLETRKDAKAVRQLDFTYAVKYALFVLD